MEGTSDSQDPLVIQDLADAPQAHDNSGSDVSDCHKSTETLSLNPEAGSPVGSPPPLPPEPKVPNNMSSLKHEPTTASGTNGLNESQEDVDDDTCDDSATPLNGTGDEVCNLRSSTPPRSRTQMSHSRGASQVSSCGASVGRMSGSTVIEENMQGWEGNSEKKLSDSDLGHTSYPKKLVSSCKCCQVFMRKHYDLPENPTQTEALKYAFTCPPHGRVGDLLIWIIAGLAAWGCLISITGDKALPGGNFFSLIVLYIMAILGGEAVQLLGLPSLLGSLLVGIFFRSIPGLNVIGSNIDFQWSAALRGIALVIILIRAGLGLDPVALRKLSFTVIRLAFSPCLVETVSTAIAAWLLLGLPWSWGFMLGFILAAVSPAVVVPSLLKLGEEGYGVDKGIPTLVIAAASIDDVLAISGFSVMLGLTFAEGSPTWTIVKGPIEIFVGLMYGVILGVLCWYLPYREKKNRPLYKLILLFVLGCLALFGSQKAALESAGAIGVLTVAFVAGLGWRKPETEDPEVEDYYKSIWAYVMPLMFSLIGSEINVVAINPDTIGWGLLMLLICLTLRVITSFFVVMGGEFTIWERLFIAIAWLPKATVQAAIGSKALDHVRLTDGSEDDIRRGEQVVTIAVMVILVTAPIGAAAIKLTGPKLLAKKASAQRSADDPETTV
ncbi:sodium/hydrogen exchanger 9B2-like isoform X3 [Macrobrachium rosenbergii]|uniref:sodium/hydrogen exchanger 9B2-like isoform X3 n=1 Tax=Macrobrachium rosenbergii TaxID=79674 RepID=UPI0034D5C26F